MRRSLSAFRCLQIRLFGLALLAGTLLPLQTVAAEPRLALVIANGAYGPDLGPLANPAHDGEIIASALRDVGFTVSLVTDVDQRGMKRAIGDFGAALAEAGPDAVGLFYFAGHGIQVAGSNYLIPVGAELKREADADLEAIDMDTVLRQMEFAGARVNVVILDACRNNPLARSVRSAQSGLARVDAPIGTFIAYSTAPGSVAQDGSGSNSPFAAALAEQIRAKNLSIEDVFRRVRVSVKDATSGQQVPWDSSSLTDGFVFNPAEVPPVAAVTATGPAEQAEIAYWQSVQDSSDPAAIELYLRNYPDGVFAGLARLKLDQLHGINNVAARNSPQPRHAFAEADFADLGRELRPAGRILPALRESALWQSLRDVAAYRAELSYKLAEAGSTRTETVTGTMQSGPIVRLARDVSDTMPWNNQPDQHRQNLHEDLLVIGTLNLTAIGEGEETWPGNSRKIYSGGRVAAIASAEGTFLPAQNGSWMEVAYTWEGPYGDLLDMVLTSKIAEDFTCGQIHPALPGRCHVVNSTTRDGAGVARRIFWTMVFIEDWGVFLPWGPFGTEDRLEGEIAIAAIEAIDD
jgi:hypothetical protein